MARIYVGKGVTDLSTTGVANTDDLVFMEGSQEVTAGLNLSGFAAGLATLECGPRFTGNIGTASAGPLRCDVDSGASLVTLKNGGGNVMLYPGGGSSLISRIKQLGQANLYLMTGGTVTNLELGASCRYASVTGDVIVTNYRQSGGEAYVQWITANSAIQTIIVDGGTVNFERFLDGNFTGCSALISDGYVLVRRTDTSSTLPTATDGSSTAHTRVCGGTLDWQGGNMDTLTVTGDGVFDAWNAPAAFTINVLNITEKAMKRSRFKSRHATVTVTTANIYNGETDNLLA